MSSTDFTCVLTLHDGTDRQHLLECLKSLSNQTSRPKQTIAVIDGQDNYKLYNGDKLVIKGAIKGAKLLHKKERNYFSVLREKLSWGEDS